MENLIKFIDFEKQNNRGRQLKGKCISVWYNLNGKQKTYGCTFSNEINTDKRKVRIGKLGDELCFVFNNDEGLNLHGTDSPNKNLIFNSKGFCEFVFKDLSGKNEGKARKVFKLQEMTKDIYVVKGEVE